MTDNPPANMRVREVAEMMQQQKEQQNQRTTSLEQLVHELHKEIHHLCELSLSQTTAPSTRPRGSPPASSSGNGETAPAPLPHLPKVELLKYDGTEDPTGWIMQVGQYFLLFNIPPLQKILYASFSLKGKALQYYKYLQNAGLISDWPSFTKALDRRFGPTEYEDPEGALAKLHQTTTVAAYVDEYEMLSDRVEGLPESFRLKNFISGLKEEIRDTVQLLRPSTIDEAIALASIKDKKKKTSFISSKSVPNTYHPKHPSLNKNPAVRTISHAEMKDRRERGLCYNCDEKFIPGHRCKTQTLFLLEATEDNPNYVDMELSDGDDETPLTISLHAISGTQTPNTMRITANLGHKTIGVLIDSGSTHNFLAPSVAMKTGIQQQENQAVSVMVANGETLHSEGRCTDVRLNLQGTSISTEFHLLPLAGFDAVLGALWLCTLGPIIWDFKKLTMEFKHEGRSCVLYGDRQKDVAVLNLMEPIPQRGLLFHICAAQITPSGLGPINSSSSGPVHKLLQRYKDIFSEPKGLPPSRAQDHQIPLIDDKPVSVRPYRYAHFQKSEIERQVTQMLKDGIIRHSHSPYSSPILLVKKSDGSWRLCVDYRVLNSITVND
ncbi:uncharacterized protein LOC143859017 [Tasmannia lanceolata]|uniref:uncharacterized protein LOC143859017 n=1 Tax=Tasmannia lanceolata TaxID=3420 RepID=UPI0040633CCE